MMAGLSAKEQRELLASLEEQGVPMRQVKSGIRLEFPDGSTEMLHRTPSENRGTMNLRASIRRAGYQWPFDGQRPKKDRPMKRRSSSQIRETVQTMVSDREEVNPTEISEVTDIQLSTVISHLRKLGFELDRPGHWRRHLHPTIPVETTATEEEEPAPVTAEKTHDGREFIDSVDSWTVKLTTSIAESTVGDLHKHYKAAGMRMEIRVWRDEEHDA